MEEVCYCSGQGRTPVRNDTAENGTAPLTDQTTTTLMEEKKWKEAKRFLQCNMMETTTTAAVQLCTQAVQVQACTVCRYSTGITVVLLYGMKL